MRLTALVSVLALALAACNAPSPEQKVAEPAPPTPAATAPPEAEVAAKPPEGTCGDQSALAAEERLANTPKWTLASEQDNFGFEVYRGDSEDGEFTRLNKEPILGAGTTDETQKYQYRDDSIDPCRDYWYYIESISTTGVREKFTPTFKAAAKRSPKADASP